MLALETQIEYRDERTDEILNECRIFAVAVSEPVDDGLISKDSVNWKLSDYFGKGCVI